MQVYYKKYVWNYQRINVTMYVSMYYVYMQVYYIYVCMNMYVFIYVDESEAVGHRG